MKAWIASLFDHEIDIQERTFRLMGAFGLSALAAMSLLSIAMGESAVDIAMMFTGLILFAAIYVLSVRTKKIQAGATVIAFMLIFVMLPAVFLASGGMYGGSPMWFLFAAIYVSMVLRGRHRIFFVVSCGVLLALCYGIQWFFPGRVTPHTPQMAYADSLASTLIVGFFAALMVVFEARLYSEEQRIAEEQRRQIEEINRAQNRFFSNMSHEIRTPVNTIIGLNEMIMREAVSADVAEDARSIKGAGQMLLALINDILDMSKIESGNMELVPVPYEVGNMLSEIVNMIWAPARDKGLEFHVEVDETIPRCLVGDEIRVKQILINLLNNAVKYTKEGSVRFAMECRRIPGEDRADMIFTVTDTGMGIRKEALPELFDVFRRMDEERNRNIEGTGLGLSIVKQLVDLMGGEITVDSVYTRGSTFRVRIPQQIAAGEAIGPLRLKSGHVLSERAAYRQSFEAPGAHILVVDDNELNARVVAKLLQATRVQVDTACSGDDCLALAQNIHYDLIFMDHLMPEKDGVQTLAELRAQKGGMNRETPVVAFTANAGAENQELYRRSGFDGYLLKPATGEQLEGAVLDRLPPELVTLTGQEAPAPDGESIVDTHRRRIPIAVTVDSAADLPEAILLRERIEMIPYRIRTREGLFVDRRQVSTEEAFAYLYREAKGRDRGNPRAGTPIEALAPTVEEYQYFFAEMLLKADHVIHVTTSAGGEGAYGNALEAARSFDNVTVFDTGLLSGGIGMLAVFAARLAASEKPMPAELVERLRERRGRARMRIVPNNTDRLRASGRISIGLHRLCQSFMLRPILSPKPGGFRVSGFLAGPGRPRLRRLLGRMLLPGGDGGEIFVLAPSLTPQDRKRMGDMVGDRVAFDEIHFVQTGVAASLCWGMDAVAIAYFVRG